MGLCKKEDDSDVDSKDLERILSVDSKENCLKQCLLKEGAKGCLWLAADYKECHVVIKSIGGSNKELDFGTCWRFITDKGKSQY